MGPVKVDKAMTVLLGAVSLAAVSAPRALPATSAAGARLIVVAVPFVVPRDGSALGARF